MVYLYAVIVRLLAVVSAVVIAIATIITGRIPHEAVLKRLVSLLVPLEVANHLLLLDKHSRVAV